MKKQFTRVGSFLIRSFLQGLIILGPISITIAVIWYVFSSIDNLIPHISETMPGLVFVLVIVATTFIGFIGTKFFLGRWLFDAFEYLLENTPGIKYIYTSIKDVMGSFVGDKKKFNNPVWVKTSANPEIWRIGFLTQQDLSKEKMDNKVAVYLPHSYAISGWVIVTPKENTKPVTGMNAAEAMKFAVSGGVTGYQEIEEPNKKFQIHHVK